MKKSLCMIKYYLKNMLKFIYPLLFLLLIYLLIEYIIHNDFLHGDTKYAVVMLISFTLPHIVYLVFLLLTVRYFFKLKLKSYKKVFFILYFLFFVFYFIFYILYFIFFILNDYRSVGEHYFSFAVIPSILYPILESVVLLFIVYFLYRKIQLLFRYLFALLAATSDIGLKYYLKQDLLSIFTATTTNEDFYEYGWFWIPLSFAIIQLTIEAYCFYKKEKPKWKRYHQIYNNNSKQENTI